MSLYQFFASDKQKVKVAIINKIWANKNWFTI